MNNNNSNDDHKYLFHNTYAVQKTKQLKDAEINQLESYHADEVWKVSKQEYESSFNKDKKKLRLIL